MPNQAWAEPFPVRVTIPAEFQTMLSFSPSAWVFTAERTYPEPVAFGGNPELNDFDYLIPLHMRSAGDIPLGGFRVAQLGCEASLFSDPTWKPSDADVNDDTTDRFQSGGPIILCNPAEVTTDGSTTHFTVQYNVDGYEPNYGNVVKAFKFQLAARSVVTFEAHQSTRPQAGCWASVIGQDGLETLWFGNYNNSPTSDTKTLMPGVYMVLVGVANRFYSGGDPNGLYELTLAITAAAVPDPPLLVGEVNDTLAGDTPVTSLVREWGRLYRYIPSISGAYSFYLNATFDAFMAVHNSAGVLLAENDDFNGSNSRIEGLMLTAGETYFISASAYNTGAVGSYTLGVVTPS